MLPNNNHWHKDVESIKSRECPGIKFESLIQKLENGKPLNSISLQDPEKPGDKPRMQDFEIDLNK